MSFLAKYSARRVGASTTSPRCMETICSAAFSNSSVYPPTTSPGMIGGRGFIVLGIVVLAKWRPALVFVFALAFGMTQGLQFLGGRLELLASIPPQFWTALPYVMTVIAVVFAPGSTYPAAVGIPYRVPARSTN